MDPLGDDVGINENSRADDSAHHRHRRPEKPELARQVPGPFAASLRPAHSLKFA